jgi:transposase
VAARAGEPGNTCDPRVDGAADAAAAGPDAAGTAAATGTGAAAAPERGLDLGTAAALGAAAQKKSLRAQEQDTGENLWRRQGWWEQIAELDPACLVFLDESGVTTEMTRRYGWAPRPQRVSEAVPAGHWRTLTVLAALTVEGVLASMTIESPTDGDVFLAFLEHALGPRLQPGHIVVLDNLGAHKVDGVRGLIESRGAQLLYLPPYSPDFNPIEQAWSKLKQLLRGARARVLDQLEPAIARAIAAITPQNARAFFSHCGYGAQQL